ncbi:hypothetical protein EV359DRAFT_74617 [Lentinula novae-zelandiae]|nr:hypothetical protein EV359DRAFT_74617 [Lentinula novae-zelandiae]
MLIGVFLNMILYGVGYLFILETANTAIDMAMMYQPLIAEYGTQKAVMNFPTPDVLISTPIQIYFAWRIRKITQTYWIPGVVVMLALASSAGGFITGVKIAKLKLFADKPELHWSALLWFLTACVADLLITGTLVWNLAQRKTGFAITDSVVDKIIRMTVQTGMITSICAIGDVAFFMALPSELNDLVGYSILDCKQQDQFYLSSAQSLTLLDRNFLWDLTLAKLYTNCLMSTLNARAGLLRPSQNSSSGTPFSLQQDVELGITVTKVAMTFDIRLAERRPKRARLICPRKSLPSS